MSDLDFTFGIVTDTQNGLSPFLWDVINSIRALNIPNYEILIIGAYSILAGNVGGDRIHIIDFNENIRPGWITRKKNLITEHARYENIVYQHDYIRYHADWYEGYKRFGGNFTACMNKILNFDGTRFRDWVIFPWHMAFGGRLARETKDLWDYCGIEGNASLLPYDETRLTRWQYFSGSYWVAKKSIMQEVSLNESLCWGQGEDLDWSARFTEKYNFSMNVNSTVQFLRQKQDAFVEMRPECHERSISFLDKFSK